MSKFTPGPWRVSRRPHGLGRVVALGSVIGGPPYVVKAGYTIPDTQVPANAQLIAHAPDMVSALKMVAHEISPDRMRETGHEPDLSYIWEIVTDTYRDATGSDVPTYQGRTAP